MLKFRSLSWLLIFKISQHGQKWLVHEPETPDNMYHANQGFPIKIRSKFHQVLYYCLAQVKVIMLYIT